ncbi:MAG: LysM domain [Verrucomicrobiota bacterium]|jgi:tetratricopeptide (TPR) repeat protein
MSLWQQRAWLAVLIGVGLCGCSRPAEIETDEQNNRYYRAGKEKLGALDYKGALECFERAVESNPRSPLFHFELALLYEQRENDYAAALYHYQRVLKLRPHAYPADNARQRIPGCRQELIKSDSLALLNPAVLRETERLREENAGLRRQLEGLQAQFAAARSNAVAVVRPPAPVRPAEPVPGRSPVPGAAGPGTPAPVETARTRTHAVRSGDTLMGIARLHRVRLDALVAANPGLDARRMRVGQLLNVPSP